jgi:PhnB protein
MAKPVKPIPDGYHTATPYMVIKNAAKAIDFYKKAFGAEVIHRMDDPEGKVRHAQIRIGDSPIMIADEFPGMSCGKSPETLGGSPLHLYLYIDDVDTWFKRAIAAGAKELMPVQDQFYGDRSGGVTDPFGHVWWLATHKEDMTEEELLRRASQHPKKV